MRKGLITSLRKARGGWLAAAALCAAAGLWVACRPAGGPAAATPAPGQRISFMVFGDPAELQAYQDLVRAFEAQHPDIGVDLIHIPSQADYRARLGADFAAGTPADVVLINFRRYAGFAARGALEPLGPYLQQSAVIQESDFYPQAVAPFRWKRQLMCVPQNISSLVVYYNKSMFEARGVPLPHADWTWNDFLAAALRLTVDADGDGRPEQHGLGVEPSLIRAAPFIWQNGGELVNELFFPRRLALDSPAAMDALHWFVDLQVKHGVVPNAEAEAAEGGESRFLNGRLGMYLNSRRGVPTYRHITEFDWDVAPLPRRNWRRAGILHADAYCMPAVVKDKQAVWRFIEFANSPAGQTVVAASGRTVPSLIAVAESPAFLDPQAKPFNSRVFVDTIPYLRAVPVLKSWADIEEIAGDEIKRAFYGHATVEEAVQAAIWRTEEYFDD